MPELISSPPKIWLSKYFENAYDHAVSTARTCYNPRVIEDTEITEGQRERIGRGCFDGGHHTVFQHATFSFAMENVSRHFVWAFLHAHPFYNSEQTSQRYVRLDEIKVTTPPFKSEEAKKKFEAGADRAWAVYNELSAILLEQLKAMEFELHPSKKDDEATIKKLEKKAIELARYVVPVAAHTSLYHTISGITLYRLHKMMNQWPTPWESRVVIQAMVDEVKKVDPNFFKDIKAPWPTESTMEHKFIETQKGRNVSDFIHGFDTALNGKRSKLISYLENGEQIMADAVRDTLGKTRTEMSDEAAIDLVVDPKQNPYLTDTLNVASMSPLMRTMNHPYFVFKKKLSHTADSQNQRHRMTPSTKPLTLLVDTPEPDYITPRLIEQNPKAKKVYDAFMKEIWNVKNELLELGESLEHVQYILPNALTIRETESGNLLNFWHKWRMRSCLTAQREIWECSIEEMAQVSEVFPKFLKYFGPDCVLRIRGEKMPYCTEGPRWCGLPVWDWKPDEFKQEKRPV